MDKSLITASTKAVSSLTEQNISLIEKVHNAIRLRRYIGQNLFLIFGALLIIGYFYIIKNHGYLFTVCILLVPFLIAILISYSISKSNNTKYTKYLYFVSIYIIAISAVMGFGLLTFLAGSDIVSTDGIKVSSIFLAIIMLLPTLLFLYSFYYASRDIAEATVRYIFRNDYKISIKLLSGEMLTGDLLNITNKNDYIVKPEEGTNEILVKNQSISYIEIR